MAARAAKTIKFYEFRNHLGQYVGTWAGKTEKEAIAKAKSVSSYKTVMGWEKNGLVLTELPELPEGER